MGKSTSMIQERIRNPKEGKLNWQQERFCLEMIADPSFDANKAAAAVGYANPAVAACKLMKHPGVIARLGKEKRLRQERTRKTSDEVLEFLERAVFFNPFKWFSPGGKGGGWLIKERDLKALPDWVGQLITECELQEIETARGSIKLCKVRFVDKARMVEFLAKHHGLFEKDNAQQSNKLVFDISELYKRPIIDDPVEALIRNPQPPKMTESAKERDAELIAQQNVPKDVKYTLDELEEGSGDESETL